jgi:hypothetical protein
MNSFLVVSREREVFWKICAGLGPDFKGTRVDDTNAALGILKDKDHAIIFVDLGVLKNAARGNGYRFALERFRRVCPTPSGSLSSLLMR